MAQKDGMKEAAEKVSRIGELGKKAMSFGSKVVGMGGAKAATGRAAGKHPEKSGGFKPIRMSAAESERRQKEADQKLAKEAKTSKRRFRSEGKR
jgi:hypothetical protein